MFPDRAALYVLAIEDRQYKDFKIHCESPSPSAGLLMFCTLGGGVGGPLMGPRGAASPMSTHCHVCTAHLVCVFSGFFSLSMFLLVPWVELR